MNQTSPLESIFFAALAKPSLAERAALLDEACGGDEELRHNVDRMLAAQAAAGSFLESPAADLAGTTDATPIAERPGANIGPYKLLQQIGEGGMGVVFMAEQTELLQRTVALKIVKPGMDTRQVIARFEAERQALAMMDHPNIAKVFDAGTTASGRPYFVMELVKGVPITKFCDERRLSLPARLELFMQVCQAVQHAHQKGIIHRDIKPNNVLVAEYDNHAVPKVIDFGVAKATAHRLTDRTMFTEFGQIVGTMEYMSPEQAKLNQLDIDTRSDIYSLGVLLYELLTGSTPFEGKRLHEAAFDEMLRIIREEEPQKPSTRLSTTDQLPSIAANRGAEPSKLTGIVRRELDWVVMKALEKDRNRRYETANGFAADVERYLHDEPVQACPPSVTYGLRKLARRHGLALGVAGGFVLLLIASTLVSSFYALRAYRAEGLAEARLVAETDARRRATVAASKATAISNMLQEALRSANPDQAKGAEYTVRELLDEMSGRLSDKLSDQPHAQAAIHATIGNAYANLGLPQVADPHLQKSLDIRRRLLGPDHPDVASSMLQHAHSLFVNKDIGAAEVESRQALAILQNAHVKDDRILRAYQQLGFYAGQQGKHAEAQTWADQAFAVAEEAGYLEHRTLATILHDLAGQKLRTNDLAEAEQLGIRSVAMHRRVHVANHPQTAWALFVLASVFEKTGKLSEADESLREALLIFRKHFPEEHKSVSYTFTNLQRVLRAKGDTAATVTLENDRIARLDKGRQAKENKE